ncbi:MAG: SpoIIE family protein phosphatase [Acidobacteriota bacterium]|nr:SpoIIE family protein phosphatase [Acidobacteriota bacterium]
MHLIVIDENGTRRSHPLTGSRLTVGRARDNDLQLSDRFASRHHAELVLATDGWQVRDRGSKAGTLLNKQRFSVPASIERGDELRIGRTRLLFDDSTEEQDISISVSEGDRNESPTHAVRLDEAQSSRLTRIMTSAVRELISHRPTTEILRSLVELALSATGADRGLVALVDEDMKPRVRAVATRAGSDDISLSRRMLARVLVDRQAIILQTVDTSAPITVSPDEVKSVLCTPLSADGQPRGILYLDSVVHPAAFDPRHFEAVTTLASLAGMMLAHESARDAAAAAEELKFQLSAAAVIQRKLLPPVDPEPLPGFSAAAYQEMCQAVGGDFYDFFSSSHGFGVMLADVAGKRLDGALIMASLHADWTNLRGSPMPPESWMRALNTHMISYLPDNRFVTLAFAVADRETNRVVYGNAGHNPAFYCHGGELRRLHTTGPVLGMFDELEFSTLELPFCPGDRLVIFSDGLPDQQNPAGEEFGDERLFRLVAEHMGELPSELRQRILHAVDEHSGDADQDDDMTLAILGREPD